MCASKPKAPPLAAAPATHVEDVKDDSVQEVTEREKRKKGFASTQLGNLQSSETTGKSTLGG